TATSSKTRPTVLPSLPTRAYRRRGRPFAGRTSAGRGFRAQEFLNRSLPLLLSLRSEALEAEQAQVSRLQYLERVDHPDRRAEDEKAGAADEERVTEIPLPVRARRGEAREDRERREECSPQV